MSPILTAVFWKEVWVWCKVNWKFILGLSIPIVLSILARRGNMKAVLRKALETREKELEIERKAAGLESSLKADAQKDFVNDVKDINNKANEDLINLDEQRKELQDSLTDPEEATKRLAEKFDLENKDED